MAILYDTAETDFRFSDRRQISSWIKDVIARFGAKTGDISVVFCSDGYLLQVNRDYLKHDYFTDIITFDYTEDRVVSGDLLISIDTVRANAEELGIDFQTELHRVIIHGILHLLGHKDKTDADQKNMRSKEDECLSLLNI